MIVKHRERDLPLASVLGARRPGGRHAMHTVFSPSEDPQIKGQKI